MRTLLCSSSIPVEPLVFCLLFWFRFLFTTSTSYGKNTWAGAGRPREREIPPPRPPARSQEQRLCCGAELFFLWRLGFPLLVCGP